MADDAETLTGSKLEHHGAPAARQRRSAEDVEMLDARGTPDARDADTLDARDAGARNAAAFAEASTVQGGPRAGEPPPSFPVERWDHYAFVRLLGQGGMGAVYEARDLRLGRAVALKFIRGGDPRLAMRLLREARAQASIRHDNICKVFEAGEVFGKAYIAMQLVEGPPLWEVAERMSLPEKVVAVRDVARALHEAHTLGILHRDVKPANILVEVTDEGRYRPIVMDFGLARDEGAEKGLTESGMLLGTPAYMSPEQARGSRDIDRRADVYSLGATLFELLSGEPPFTGDTPVKIVLAVLNDEPPKLRARARSVPEELETIVGKCLRKEPDQRYDSAKALADDLDRYLRGEPIFGRREGLARRLGRLGKKHRALVVTAAIALAALIVVGGYGIRERILAARRAAEMEEQAAIERELGQDVKEMVWFLRTAHLLPLHDIRRERDIVKERMRRIEARAPLGGPIAALVDYAIGRAHLALHEDVEAHERLARAQRAGLDTPELHHALGLALGRRYERALADARRGGDPRWIELRTKEAEEQYLRPALVSMERSRAVQLEAPKYLDGLVAFYNKDYDAALRYAEEAHAEAPWLYEAQKLRADVLLARGIERKDRGELDAGALDLEQSARIFDAAATVGRSDAALYEGSAEALGRRMELDTDRGLSPEAGLEGVLDRCRKAAEARPDRAAPFTRMAYAHDFLAKYLLKRGQDPRPALERELAVAEHAREVDGGDFEAYERLGTARLVMALYELDHGIDPRPSITEITRNAEHASRIDPRHPWAIALLAFGHDLRGRHAMRSGADPTPHFRTALETFRRAAQIDKGYAYAYVNALWVYGFWAQWLAGQGEDPTAALAPVAEVFEACMRANAFSECQENLGVIEYWRAEYLYSVGRDPGPAMATAAENLEKAGAIQKDFLENKQFLAALQLLRVKEAARRGEELTAPLAAFEEVLSNCYSLSRKDPMCALLDARRALLLVDAEAAAGALRRATLERALERAALAVAANPPDADAHEALAQAERRLAVAAVTKAERGKHRSAGLAACAAGLAVNPVHRGLLAVQKALGDLP